jgi:hypothetical protein
MPLLNRLMKVMRYILELICHRLLKQPLHVFKQLRVISFECQE